MDETDRERNGPCGAGKPDREPVTGLAASVPKGRVTGRRITGGQNGGTGGTIFLPSLHWKGGRDRDVGQKRGKDGQGEKAL